MTSNFQKSMAVGLTIFSNYAFASTLSTQPTHSHYNNFYIGADIGAASLMDKESTNIPIRDIHNLSAAGIVGGGLIGYDFTLHDPWKLGLEGFMNATDLNLSTNQNYAPSASYKVNMHYNLGLRMLPGYEFTAGTVVHAILGYSYGSFHVKDNGDYGIINTQFSKSGFQCGLGMKTPVYKTLSIRGDVIYTAYLSQNSSGLTTSTPASTQIYYNNLSALEGDLSLIYKFS